jgi:hypothetical protein
VATVRLYHSLCMYGVSVWKFGSRADAALPTRNTGIQKILHPSAVVTDSMTVSRRIIMFIVPTDCETLVYVSAQLRQDSLSCVFKSSYLLNLNQMLNAEC